MARFNDLGLTIFNYRYCTLNKAILLTFTAILLLSKAILGSAHAYICDNVCFSYKVNDRNLYDHINNLALHQPITTMQFSNVIYTYFKKYVSFVFNSTGGIPTYILRPLSNLF